jgi:hypothetical protein
MTTSQGPVSDTEAMLTAERNHSSSSVLPPDDVLSNGLLLEPSGPKQNGHTNNDDNSNNSGAIHHSNGHSAANGSIFGSEVYVYYKLSYKKKYLSINFSLLLLKMNYHLLALAKY